MDDLFLLPVPCQGEVPTYATAGSAGADLRFSGNEELTIEPMGRELIATDCRLAIPKGHVGFVCPRSGLAVKHGITVLNGPGVIDCDYRGEIKVALVNLGAAAFTVEPGTRIAQLVILPFVACGFLHVEELPETERGSGGFGSSGDG